ncbi:hypothetical protein [Oxalobacter paraformigenes]|uniref:Uncharacterized protein n=1 Tax=Oxalobacter paraformigenes TaxID=556268 RepID=C3X3Q1_9BURK|nr:hypothetical protein [Oxalobacter paraformigenes]EEO27837.1 hypothetical protein OFAG_00990 [Oxalobacter paraformigenes]
MNGKEAKGTEGAGRERMARQGSEASLAEVEALFSEFEALYGSRFADMWRHTDVARVKSLWAKALAGLTGREIRAGLAGCGSRPWPPSLPEFLTLCRPEADAERAFSLAQELVSRRFSGEDVWPDRALYWAAVAFGFYDLRSMSWAAAKNRWSRIWAGKRQMEAELPPVPVAREALASPGRNLTDRETARRRLGELKRLLRGRPAEKGGGGKAAKGRLARPDGEPSGFPGRPEAL